MNIRIHASEDECREIARVLAGVLVIESFSGPFPDGGSSGLWRLYLEVAPRGER